MRIGIDVQPLQTGTRYGGIGHALSHLLRQLSRVDHANEYRLLLNSSDYLESVHPPSPRWKSLPVRRKHRLRKLWWLWDTLYLPSLLLNKGLDIYHYNSLSELEPMAPPYPFGTHRLVATIYDVIPLKFPDQSAEYFSSSLLAFDYSAKFKRLKYADAIITISECSKYDIVEFLDYPPERITVAYCGVSEEMKRPASSEEQAQFTTTYELPEQFILYIGGYYSQRKNLARLFDAYKMLCGEAFGNVPPLVLAGLSNPVHKARIASLLAKKRLTRHVMSLPYIPNHELPLLYRAATLFVYPSLYEGFGLPVAEAMACGTVVVTSKTSSLPEVVGDAGLYFDPCDPISMAEKMNEGLTNIATREKLQKNGPKRAELFSWEQAARSVLSVYQHVYDSR